MSEVPAASFHRIQRRQAVMLLLFGLAGAVAVLVATSRYGIGLSPDSTYYIDVARSLVSSKRIPSYFIFQPPLYPAVLAITGFISRVDPLMTAHWVNAVLFGLIVIMSGLVFFRRFGDQPRVAILGLLLIIVSRPLFRVSVMAWSEPLAIFLMTLALYALERFLAGGERKWLATFIASGALASLSRYMGATVVISGVLAILFSGPAGIRKKAVLVFSTALAGLPLAVWAARNFRLSGTFFGANHIAGVFGLPVNLSLTGSTIFSWVIPFEPTSFAVYLVSIAAAAAWWFSRRHSRFAPSVWLLFGVVYTAALVFMCTLFNFDKIGDRLLSPIYMPVIFMLLAALSRLDRVTEKILPKAWRAVATAVVAFCVLAFPAKSFYSSIALLTADGAGGFSTTQWRESKTLAYVRQHRDEFSGKAYSNWPDAVYMLTGAECRISPERTFYNSFERSEDLSQLQGRWPDTSRSALIWLNKREEREFLYADSDLQTIAQFDPIRRFEDGTIYSIRRSTVARHKRE